MLGNSATLKTAVCLFYIGNEGISIVENAEKLGVPIPKFLHGKFLSFTEENAKADIERKKHQNSWEIISHIHLQKFLLKANINTDDFRAKEVCKMKNPELMTENGEAENLAILFHKDYCTVVAI